MSTSARDRLLAAADELFYAHGIAATGVDAVITRAGVAIGSLYNNFGGKDGLVTAYLDARHERFRALWEARIAAHDNAGDRVLALFDTLEAWTGDGANHNGCADLAAVTQLDDAAPARSSAIRAKRAVADRLRTLVDATGSDGPDELTADLLVIYEGVLSLLAVGPDPDPVRRGRRLAEQLLAARGCGCPPTG